MTFEEKIAHIETALSKLRQMRQEGDMVFDNAEYDVIDASLEITADICATMNEWRKKQRE